MKSSSVAARPLTTIFTPPRECFPTSAKSTEPPLSGPLCFSGTCYAYEDPSCFPIGAAIHEIAPAINGDIRLTGGFGYSPGVLPSGFRTVFATAFGDTTLVRGCPEGYEYLPSPVCYTVNLGHTTAIPYVEVLWASRDLARFKPASAPAHTTPGVDFGPLTLSSGAFTSTTMPESTPQGHSEPLSKGAEAGIGVGVGLAAILLLGLGFIILRRRGYRTRTRAAWLQPDNPPPYSEHYDRPELPDQDIGLPEMPPDHRIFEIPDRERGELEVSQSARELSGISARRELETYERPQEMDKNA